MDPNNPNGLEVPLQMEASQAFANLAERYRLEQKLLEIPDPDERGHKIAAEFLARLGTPSDLEAHILRQLAWLADLLHRRELDSLEVGDRVSVTLRGENRPWLGCSEVGSVVRVARLERDEFTGRTTGVAVTWPGKQHYLLRGVELRDVRLMEKRAT